MAKTIKIFIIFLLIIGGASFADFYFDDNMPQVLDSFKSSIVEMQKLDVGSVVSEIQNKVLTTGPLNVGGKSNDVTLTKIKILEETNKQRVANGFSSLNYNELLYQAALLKANDMFSNQYFDHTSPNGIDPGMLVSNCGYEYIITGENLILGNFENEEELVEDWMNSPGHRANILNDKYTEIGVSVIKGEYKGESVWVAVQEFALPISACNPPDEDLKNKINNKEADLESIISVLDDKKEQIDNTDNTAVYYKDLIENYNKNVQEYNSLVTELKSFILNYNNQINYFNNCVLVFQEE